MAIHKLPEYMINRLKAGEVVERPASVIKELVENSLDAGATHVKITVNDGGKSLISVEDNGTGIELSDMDLLLERYATSKINGEQDLYNLQSYGFRGEALASIAEVSKTSIISKTAYAEIATKLTKIQESLVMKHVPVGFKHGTIVSIQDLFYNVPARLKFLKSTQTEYFYCYNYFVEVALFHYEKHFTLLKNDKVAFDLPPVDGLMERILQIWRKDRSKYLNPLEAENENIRIQGVISDAGLTFGSAETVKIYVNGRPVIDKIIKKSLLDAYVRQITPGEYPFAILMLTVKPSFVDVNVHPKKLEVKFLDPNQVFSLVNESVKRTLGIHKIVEVEHKISQRGFDKSGFVNWNDRNEGGEAKAESLFSSDSVPPSTGQSGFSHIQSSTIGFSGQDFQEEFFHEQLGTYQVVGQVWNSYIVLSTNESLFYVDQHALAERIAFEKMKKAVGYAKSELLLQPLTVDIPKRGDIEQKIDQINKLGFDCSLLSENKIIVYAVPQIFSVYKIDIDNLFTYILALEKITFDHVLDAIFATKACKTSIKAGDTLSYEQMTRLLKDGFEYIEGMFVCQHGRPFFVKIEKKTIDKFFDR
ncbi:MAG: DNA mismatch repair endonuclease MutL [Candidatus Absconditabacteria bacterium]|nr:DNA mismatch repair endonuclease MutL [Candidatus Absconditabacteria bacterium]